MLTYRDGTEKDLKGLSRLVEDYCIDNDINYVKEDIDNYVLMNLKNFKVIVAEKDELILGAISYTVLNNPYNVKELFGRKMGIFVNKDERGTGIGSTLIHLAEENCKHDYNVTKFFLSSPKTVKGYKQNEIDQVKEL